MEQFPLSVDVFCCFPAYKKAVNVAGRGQKLDGNKEHYIKLPPKKLLLVNRHNKQDNIVEMKTTKFCICSDFS